MSGSKPVNWVQPADIKVLPSFQQTSHIDYGDEEPGPSTDLYPSWYVEPTSVKNVSQVIDKVSGGLATSCTPALAKETVGSQNENRYSIDLFWPIGTKTSGAQATITTNDTVHQCGDQLPTISLQSASPTCNGSSCSIGVNIAQGTHPLYSSAFPTQIIAIVGGKATPATCSFTPDITTSPSAATGQCSFAYGGGATSIQMEVVDSVLYSATTSAINVNAPTITSGTNLSTNSTITWTGGTGPYTVTANGSTFCSVGAGVTSCTGTLAPGSYTIRVEDDSDGNFSSTETVQVS
jgi:hypothetical protein